MDATQLEKIRSGQGFFAALDQSGGSTPKALADYGIDESRYSNDDEMFDLVHAMRTRIVTNPAFDGRACSRRSCSSRRWTVTWAASRPRNTCGTRSRSCRS